MSLNNDQYSIRIEPSFQGMDFSLKIQFELLGNLPYRLMFENRSGKFERLWLTLRKSGSDEKIPKSGYRIYKFASGRIEGVQLNPNEPFVYLLLGKYDGRFLNFRGASYELVEGETYSMTINYFGVISNEVEVVVPFISR